METASRSHEKQLQQHPLDADDIISTNISVKKSGIRHPPNHMISYKNILPFNLSQFLNPSHFPPCVIINGPNPPNVESTVILEGAECLSSALPWPSRLSTDGHSTPPSLLATAKDTWMQVSRAHPWMAAQHSLNPLLSPHGGNSPSSSWLAGSLSLSRGSPPLAGSPQVPPLLQREDSPLPPLNMVLQGLAPFQAARHRQKLGSREALLPQLC